MNKSLRKMITIGLSIVMMCAMLVTVYADERIMTKIRLEGNSVNCRIYEDDPYITVSMDTYTEMDLQISGDAYSYGSRYELSASGYGYSISTQRSSFLGFDAAYVDYEAWGVEDYGYAYLEWEIDRNIGE